MSILQDNHKYREDKEDFREELNPIGDRKGKMTDFRGIYKQSQSRGSGDPKI